MYEYLGVFAAELHIPPREVDRLSVTEFFHLCDWIDRQHAKLKQQNDEMKDQLEKRR